MREKEVISDAIALFMPESDEGQDGLTNLTRAQQVLDELKAARIAVVELPEPQEREDDAEIATCWDALPYQALVWDEHPDEVQVAYNYESSEPLSPSEARDLAVALLAAADAAEAVSHD